MKLGIKVAPGNAWKSDIEATRPSMVEIWYNATQPGRYDDLFAYLKHKPIDVGFHFWGVLPNGLLPNISYPDPQIAKPSLELMHAAIDVAADHGCAYVNIHPDLYSLLHVNFDTMDIRVASEPVDFALARKTYIDKMLQLNTYAKSKGVLLIVETVPMRDTPSWKPDRDRTRVIDIHQMPVDVHIDLAAQGISIANDFCHTACNELSGDRTKIWKFLWQTTQTLAPATRLIHLGYLVPPYNGVDFHDSLDNPVLVTSGAIPNTEEMMTMLKLFTNRNDVWILVEPKEDHVKNYSLAKELLKKAGVI